MRPRRVFHHCSIVDHSDQLPTETPTVVRNGDLDLDQRVALAEFTVPRSADGSVVWLVAEVDGWPD